MKSIILQIIQYELVDSEIKLRRNFYINTTDGADVFFSISFFFRRTFQLSMGILTQIFREICN